jgi:hypothetical protein
MRKDEAGHIPATFPTGSKNPRSTLILPTRHFQFKFQRNVDDEPRGPKEINQPASGGPTRRLSSPPDASLILDREALRAPAMQT